MVDLGPYELLVIAALFGGTTAYVAHLKGLRRPARYFVLGVLLPVLSLLVLAAVPARRRTDPLARG